MLDLMATTCLAVQEHPLWLVWDIVLSVMLFATTVMVVLTLFRKPGEIQISHQRQAAIATGHSDRATIFESAVLGPILWCLLAAAHSLSAPRVKQWMRQTLVSAGNPKYYTAEEYIAMGLFYGLVVGVILDVFHLMTTGEFSLVLTVFGFACGMGIVICQLWLDARKRVREISKRVPYALDLISLAMGSGATFVEAVEAVVHDASDEEDPFNTELKTLLAEMELGSTRQEALQNLAERVRLDMIRTIVASVIQSEQLGTPLTEVLHSQANLLRLQRSVKAENAAAVASVRILVPGLLILISVIVAVFGPAIMAFVSRGGLF